ncbi:MAG: radical SAM/SPASM domain-containing protein [Planctomycetota bacterium]
MIRQTLGRWIRKKSSREEAYHRLRARFHDSAFPPLAFLRRFLASRRRRRAAFPEVVNLETASVCNARCVMCPYGSMKRSREFMPMDLYRRLVDECAEHRLPLLWTFLIGEPLLDKTLADKIRYAKKRGIPTVGFYTNGSLLDGARAGEIFDAGTDHISISMDGGTRETFEAVRRGLSFETVEGNIRGLMRLRGERRLARPRVVLDFVVMEENRNEAEEFRRRWSLIVDDVYFARRLNWTGDLSGDEAPAVTTYRVRRPCFRLWSQMVVLSDGRVPLCCNDYEGRVILGDARESSLSGIWRSGKMEEIRRAHLAGEYDRIPICASCNAWESLAFPWWW